MTEALQSFTDEQLAQRITRLEYLANTADDTGEYVLLLAKVQAAEKEMARRQDRS